MKIPSRQGAPIDFQTPPFALEPLFPYLDKSKTIWECAQGFGWLSLEFKRKGYGVIGSDILDGRDYTMWQPREWDICVTNPPYSIKQKFLERAYALGKPFAFLLPLTTFETEKRARLFRDNGVEVIFLDNRINFRTPSGEGSGAWFATAWFTWGLRIGREMTFAHIPKPKEQNELMSEWLKAIIPI